MPNMLSDYREMLAGAEEDLRRANDRYTELIAEIGTQSETVILGRARVERLKKHIAAIEQYSAVS